MATIPWHPKINALTTPQSIPKSYTVRCLPREVLGYDELTKDTIYLLTFD